MQPLSRPKVGAAPAQYRHGNHRVKLKSPARSLFAQVTVAYPRTRGNWLTRGREGMGGGGRRKKERARWMHGGTCMQWHRGRVVPVLYHDCLLSTPSVTS